MVRENTMSANIPEAQPQSDLRPNQAEPAQTPDKSWLRKLWPRPETSLLLVGLLCTLGAKWWAVRQHKPDSQLIAWLEVSLQDVLFFSTLGLVFCVLYVIRMHFLIARLTMLAAAAVLGWSVLNSAWLIATGVQLQPDVLKVLSKHPLEFFPVVMTHLKQHPAYATAAGLAILAALIWFLWRIIRPALAPRRASAHIWRASRHALVLAASLLGISLANPWFMPSYASDVLSFSSPWYALVDTVNGDTASPDVQSVQQRQLPRAGQRKIIPPAVPHEQLPNIVVLFLESISYAATSLSGPEMNTTPTLVQIASEGVEFVSTRVPLPLTDKAFWSVLTGSVPDIQSDFAEAVLADEPYEGLPSILSRSGYRSAFFEMSKGGFECAPGFFANLAFDWAWFRENLEDPSAHIGPLGGDDFRAIGPAFDWVDSGTRPFLLGMITTVAHYPYEVPAWFAESKGDTYECYLQSVRFSDAFVAEVDKQLEQRSLKENTLLCIIGDHGESFRPEVRKSRWAPFEEVIRVPWIIRWPGRIQSALRIDRPCSQIDVMPTILNLLGFDITEAGFDGRDAMKPDNTKRRLYFSAWYPHSPHGYVEGQQKLVYWPSPVDKIFAYDLDSDPQEKSPRSIKGPEKNRIIKDLEQWRRKSQFVIPATRFRERVLYEHWSAFSSGRTAWAYYVPRHPDGGSPNDD